MSDIVISVENLGKKYRIRHQKPERYTALRDVLADKFTAPWRALASTLRNAGKATNGNGSNLPAPSSTLQAPTSQEDFWALRDVSFEVKRGEVVGVIGRNGAGKSTLLKILSRITEPTEGWIEIEGRVASLLEVGAGFHPELTGRENIYLNGAILGMHRVEIKAKFDEIVAFAEVEKFLDTPVKHYSSGMYVRLAFAVAAHLEPEILIVDEVLAVGDAEFQRKCLGKMGDVARGGRTVLLVSHQMAAVENLCQNGILLHCGRVDFRGPAADVIAAYAKEGARLTSVSLIDRSDRLGNGVIRFVDFRLLDENGRNLAALKCGETAILELKIRNVAAARLRNLHVSIGVGSKMGQRVTTWSTTYAGEDFESTPACDFSVRIRLPRVALMPGVYMLNVFSTVNGEIADWLLPAIMINVEPGDYYGTGRLPGGGDGTFVSEHSFALLIA